MRMRLMAAALLAGAALGALPAAGLAQDARDLDSEASNVRNFNGSVAAGEPAVFHVAVPAGQTLRIDVLSTSELDPMLKVTDRATNEMLAEDDDGGDDLNSRATIQGGETGRNLRLEVSAYSYEGAEDEEPVAAGGGSFDLRLTTLTFDPQAVRALTWGGEATGTLGDDTPHEFTFQGETGMLLDIALDATDYEGGLDPYLELRDEFGEVLASNDDSAGGLNARLRYVMQDDRVYHIFASPFAGTLGDYVLRVGERREPLVQAPLQVIGIGDRATGRLGPGYEEGAFDPQWIDYQLSDAALAAIRAGNGEVTIHMNGTGNQGEAEGEDYVAGFNSYLELGFDTPLGFAIVQSDDDGAGNLNAMIPVDLSDIASQPELLDRLRIRAKAFSGSEGDYELIITEGLEERQAYEDEYASEAMPPPPMVVPTAD